MRSPRPSIALLLECPACGPLLLLAPDDLARTFWDYCRLASKVHAALHADDDRPPPQEGLQERSRPVRAPL